MSGGNVIPFGGFPAADTPGLLSGVTSGGGHQSGAARLSLFEQWLRPCAIDTCGDCGRPEREIQFCRDRFCPHRKAA